MFRLTRLTADEIALRIEVASGSEFRSAEHLAPESGLRSGLRPRFVHDRLRTQVGEDRPAFEFAVRAFQEWKQFDLGWVRVATPTTRIAAGGIVAVEVHSLGLWSLNLSQIVEAVQTEHHFGFIYKTTTEHVEEGEERFQLMLDAESGAVWYETEAVSRPRSLLAGLGYPITRAFQHRFARDSHQRVREAVAARYA